MPGRRVGALTCSADVEGYYCIPILLPEAYECHLKGAVHREVPTLLLQNVACVRVLHACTLVQAA